MTVFDRAVKALNDVDEYIDHLADNDAYVTALEAAGLLAPDVQVIRTVEELEALDLDTVLIDSRNILETWGSWLGSSSKAYPPDAQFLPAVVVATGEQVRAARKAMEEEHG